MVKMKDSLKALLMERPLVNEKVCSKVLLMVKNLAPMKDKEMEELCIYHKLKHKRPKHLDNQILQLECLHYILQQP